MKPGKPLNPGKGFKPRTSRLRATGALRRNAEKTRAAAADKATVQQKTTIRQLKPGEPLPPGQPKRYKAGHGYIRLRWRTAPRQYVETYEHRVDGDRVTTAEHVHHRNRQRDDNSPENLELLTAAEHLAHHHEDSVERREEMVKLYETGWSTTKIATVLGVTSGCVSRQLRMAGTEMKPFKAIGRNFDEVAAVAMYAAGAPVVEVQRAFHVSAARIMAEVDKAGVQRHPAGRPKASAKSPDIPSAVRKLVIARDEDLCVRCGIDTTGQPRSVHHRKPRGMGGSRFAHAPANLILLCGTGTTGCHGFVESERDQARDCGYIVHRGDEPASRPVWRHGRTWQLPTSDGWADCAPPADTDINREDAA